MKVTYQGLNYQAPIDGERISPVFGCNYCNQDGVMPHLMRTIPVTASHAKTWHPRQPFRTHPPKGWTKEHVLMSNKRIFDTIARAQKEQNEAIWASRDPLAVVTDSDPVPSGQIGTGP